MTDFNPDKLRSAPKWATNWIPPSQHHLVIKREKSYAGQQIRTGITKVGMGLVVAILACGAALAQDVATNSMPGVGSGSSQ